MNLEQKTAVITGGASGIGLATAKAFAARGMQLVLADIEPATLAGVVDAFTAQGVAAIGVPADVAQEDDMLAVRDAALTAFGGAHVLFNNAGVGGGSVIGSPKAVWDWVIGVNVMGVVNGLNAFLPVMLEQNEGHVVNTASLAGLGGVPGMGPYCASKFAVVGLSESLYYELLMRRSDVKVSVLCPGFVNTRIYESERNAPDAVATWRDSADARTGSTIAKSVVTAGIEPERVADAIVRTIDEGAFYILTHTKSALRTTEMRLEWMKGGAAPSFDLEKATKG